MVKKYVFRQKIDIFVLIYFELSSTLVCMLLTCVKLFLAVILIPHLWNLIDKYIYYKYFPYLRKCDGGGHLDDVITGSSSQFMQCYLPISWAGGHNGSENIGSPVCGVEGGGARGPYLAHGLYTCTMYSLVSNSFNFLVKMLK
jgi:hypothetical protein